MSRNFLYLILFVGLLLSVITYAPAKTIIVTSSNDSGPGSLRAAVSEANTNGEDDTIILPSGLYTTLGGAAAEDDNVSGDLDIKSDIVIQGVGAANTYIDGNYNDRIFHILSGTVTIMGVTLTKGAGPGRGGGIKVEAGAAVTISECTLSGNRAISDGEPAENEGGGGIYVKDAVISIRNCTISNNDGGFDISGMGGGIWIDNSSTHKYAEIRDCLIKDNTGSTAGTGWGGGLYLKAGADDNYAAVSGNTFENNAASTAGWGMGGAIYLWQYAAVDNNRFLNNYGGKEASTAGQGGAIYLWEVGGAVFNANRFVGNTACEKGSGFGGAIYTDAGNVFTMTNNLIVGNHASSNGGGMYMDFYTGKTTQCTLYNNTIADNNPGAGGEGIYLRSYITLTMKNNIIKGHTRGIDNSTDPGNNTIAADTNLFWNNSDAWIGTHPIHQDPLLTDDYKLVANSPAVDSGLTLVGVTDDLEGVPRPQGSGYDIGAYEYVSNPSFISVDRTQLNFGASGSHISTGQWFRVSNSGGGTLNWTAVPAQEWIQVSPSGGVNSGTVTVSVDPDGLDAGNYTGTISITAPSAVNSPQPVTVNLDVYSSGDAGLPFGEFSTPTHNSTVRSSIPVTGWVLDDIGLESVKIYRAEGDAQVFVGDAVFVEGARPDVEQAYPGYPFNYQAGWGYMMLTNFLPDGGNGTYTIYARAVDIEGNEVTLGSKTIICDNANAVKPFGAIDTPAQGGAASGSHFVNFGWVLTPLPNTIPTDGSTIDVMVDGVTIGHPTYNNYRSDIAALFPGYNNSSGAVGYFYLDTTAYANGVHTIQWTAGDDAGNMDGIGSRYFVIDSGAVEGKDNVFKCRRSAFNVDPIHIPVDNDRPVMVKKGYNKNSEPQIVYPGEDGTIYIEINETEPLEIHLFGAAEPASGTSLTHRRVNISPFPVGATLDTDRGVFYWLPGVGFVGRYRFVVAVEDRSGIRSKRFFDINILPRFAEKR